MFGLYANQGLSTYLVLPARFALRYTVWCVVRRKNGHREFPMCGCGSADAVVLVTSGFGLGMGDVFERYGRVALWYLPILQLGPMPTSTNEAAPASSSATISRLGLPSSNADEDEFQVPEKMHVRRVQCERVWNDVAARPRARVLPRRCRGPVGSRNEYS